MKSSAGRAIRAAKSDRLTVRMLPDEDDDINPYVLIEGTREVLCELAEMIIFRANYTKDCGYQMHPRGAASKFFSKASEVGIYIHRLPCMHIVRPTAAADQSKAKRPRKRKPV